jgi:hypothetical protein
LAVGLKQARLQFMQDWKQMNADKYKNQRLWILSCSLGWK